MVDDTAPRNLDMGSLIKLDSLFNGRWNTSTNATFGSGTYRVYAAATDENDADLINKNGQNISTAYNFTVDLTSSPTVDLGSGAFIVEDNSASRLMVIDNTGNLNIKGSLTENTIPSGDANDFIIQNSTGGENAVLFNPSGNLHPKRDILQNQQTLSPTLGAFVIQNSTGATVAYVNSTGSLFLTGTLTEHVVFG